MTPSEYTYFDYYQGDARREPLSIGGFIPLEKAYAYEPVPKQIAKDKENFILGAQAQLWTEYVATPEHAEYMMFPRLLALSGGGLVAGGGPELRRFPAPVALSTRSPRQAGRALPDSRTRGTEGFLHDLAGSRGRRAEPALPGARCYYTLDGSEPSDDFDALSGAPADRACGPNNRNCSTSRCYPAGPAQRRLRRDVSAPCLSEPKRVEAQPRLAFALFDGKFASVQDIERGAKAASGNYRITRPAAVRSCAQLRGQFDGFLKVEADDFYQFVVDSDDGAVLEIDDEVVVDNDGNHAPRTIAGHVPLRRGLHKFRLRYFQAEGGSSLGVSWAKSNGPLQPLEGSALYRAIAVPR